MSKSCRSLGKKEPLRDGIREAGIEQAEIALSLLVATELETEELIHDLRVTSKRLRALWQFARPAVGSSLRVAANRELRDMAKLLADERAISVFRPLIRELENEPAEAAAPSATKGIEPSLATELERTLRTELERWQHLKIQATDHELLVRGFGGTFRRAQKWQRRASERADFATFHTLRKWTKYLRYQLELLLPVGGAQVQHLYDPLERLGQLLGLLNDLVELEAETSGDPALAGPMRLSMGGRSQLHRRTLGLKKECEELGAEIYAQNSTKVVGRLVSSLLD